MSGVDFSVVRELFLQLRPVEDAAERARLLNQRCAGDEHLRREVESLLEHACAARPRAEFIESGAIPGGLSSVLAEVGIEQNELPEMIGQYRIVRIVGEGGMGTVYEARQQRPDRRVALKVLRTGVGSRSVLRRFEQESQILARLQHVGIAQVYESGTFGPVDRPSKLQPFFAMEFVEGLTISQFVARHRLPSREVLALGARVADAVEHAHLRGVVHRDLKPANILVTDDGQPKVLDFGVARATVQDAPMTSARTDIGQIIGTVAYMSPEQVSGTGMGEETGGLDQRSDVYSLGVVLYELLTGRLPHDVRSGSIAHAAQRIINEEPPRMSGIRRELRRDIETVVRKAMEKDAARRYQSAGELSADLRRILNNQPITARPATTVYQLRKFAQRNRALAAGIGLAAAALTVGTAVSVFFAVNENRLRHIANEHEATAKASDAAARRTAYRLALSAADSLRTTDPVKAMSQLEAAPPELRGWEWNYLRRQLDQIDASLESDRQGDGSAVAIGSAGRPLAAIVSSGAVKVLDIATGRVVALRQDAEPLTRPELSSDGTIGAAMTPTRHVVVFDAEGREAWRSPIPCDRYCLSEDGKRVGLATEAGLIRLYATAESSKVVDWEVPTGGRLREISFEPESGLLRVLWALPATNIHVGAKIDPNTGLVTKMKERLSVLGFHTPAGEDLSLVPIQHQIDLVRRSTGEVLKSLRGHMRPVTAIAVSADGSRLVSASEDLTLRVWDLTRGVCEGVSALAFAPRRILWMSGGERVLVTDGEGHIALMRLPGSDDMILRGHASFVYHALFSPDGRWVASAGWGDEVNLWEAASGRLIAQLANGPGRNECPPVLGFTADSRELVAKMPKGVVRRWRVDGDISDPVVELPSAIRLMPVWGVLKELASNARGTDTIGGQCACMSPDGQRLALAPGRKVSMTSAGSEIVTEFPWMARVHAVAFSPDGKQLAAAGTDTHIYLVNAQTGEIEQTLRGHRGTVYTLCYSPDGTRLASGGDDNSIIIWEPKMGEQLLELHRHSAYVHAVSFSSEGANLVSGSGDGTICIMRSGQRSAP